MLVLSRKQSERIVIGSSILITVLKVEGSQVRLGIEAPEDLTIVRSELLTRRPRRSGGLDSQAGPSDRPSSR